jgi:hypothetical protein
MGKAKITGGGPTGLYDIEIVKDGGRATARQAAITIELGALETKIGEAVIAKSEAETALADAVKDLDTAIAQKTTPPPL